MPGAVYVSPTGRRISVDAKDVQMYERLGYKPETVEEASALAGEAARETYYSRADEQVKAVIEGVYSGATAGIYDMAAGADSETARRAKYNPGKRLAGEIAGGILGTALPIGKGITAITTPAKEAGYLARGVGAAAEGSIYGTAASVAQARLNGDPLTAETIVHGAGPGALLGLGAETVASGVRKMARGASGRKAAEAVADLEYQDAVQGAEQRIAAAQETLKELGPESTSRASAMRVPWDNFRVRAKEVAQELEQQVRGAEDTLRKARTTGSFSSYSEELLKDFKPANMETHAMLALAKKSTLPDAAGSLASHPVNTAEIADDIMGRVALLDPATQKQLGPEIARLRKAAAKAETNPKAYAEATEALRSKAGFSEEKGDFALSTGKGTKEVPMVGGVPVTRSMDDIGMELDAAALRNPAGGWVPGALRTTAKQADAAISSLLKGGDPAEAMKAATAYFKVLDRAKLPYPKTGWASMGPAGLKMALDAADEAKTLTQVYKNMENLPRDLSSMTKTQADKFAAAFEQAAQKNPMLKDELDLFMERVGIQHDGSVAEKVYAVAETYKNMRVSEFNSQKSRQAAGAALRARQKAARAEMAAAKKEIAELTKEFEQEGKSAGKARGKSVAERVAGYLTVGLGAKMGAKYFGNNMMGRTVGVIATTGIASGRSLLGGVMSAKSRMTGAMDSILARWGGPGADMVRRGTPAYAQILRHTLFDREDDEGTLPELVKRRVRELDEMMSTLPDQAYAAAAWLDDEHPDASAAVQAWFTNAITYLQSVAPKNPGTVWVGGKDRWLPSELKARDFADRWIGAFHPIDAGMAYLRGEASAATIQSLANTNPGIYGYFRDRMIARLTDPKVLPLLTREQRAQASWFTGVPLDSLDERHSVEFFQQQFANAQSASRVPPPPAAAQNPGGRPPATQSQAQTLTYR